MGSVWPVRYLPSGLAVVVLGTLLLALSPVIYNYQIYHHKSKIIQLAVLSVLVTIIIVGNFLGVIISWISWLKESPHNFNP